MITDGGPVVDDRFERLLDALPRIADSVKQFESEQVQQQVIDGLLQALMAPAPTSDDGAAAAVPPADSEQEGPTPPTEPSVNGEAKPATARKRRNKSGPKVDAVDFDWSPANAESLSDFVARKQPRTKPEQNLVVIFYLEQVVKHSPITVGHVVSGFYACGWDVPTDPRNSLSVARSSTKGIETSNLDNIEMTHLGRNIVNNQLPRPAKAK